ncbi:MAG: hypothetical protein LBG26_05200 [Treponema sp.]|nr:hypothetical protein [Treponema sp.]
MEKAMLRITEEEAAALDEQVTRNPPQVSGDGKSGFFMKHKGNIVILDDLAAAYLRTKADAAHKTPSEIIGDMIRKELAAAT